MAACPTWEFLTELAALDDGRTWLVGTHGCALRAMMNPAAFVKQYFPDIPDNIQNDPNQVFNYLQQTRPQVTGQQIKQAQQTAGQIIGQGNVR